ncbi:MAG: tetratricopeptide repeat protein [Verrucomicrobiota bacterium]
MRRHLFISLLLAGITFLLYWPAGDFEVVCIDDTFFTDNPEVQSGLNLQSLRWAVTSVVAANWHPVTSLSFILTHECFGHQPGAEHLINAALHAANAALLFLVLVQLMGVCRQKTPAGLAAIPDEIIWPCALVAALFAWHPLRVESVAWISERKDVLCGFFLILTLGAYARYVEEAQTQGPRAGRFFGLSLMLFALGLLSKAMVVTLPFLLLLLDVWPLNRLATFRPHPATGSRSPGEQRSIRNRAVIMEKWPFFALTAAFCLLTFLVQRNADATPSLQQLGPGLRLENVIASYLRYLLWTLWPTQLAAYYPFPIDDHSFLALWPGWGIGFAAALLAFISAACCQQLRARPYLFLGWFWYLGTMVPVIGLVQVGGQGMADRYTYLPLIGPVISLIWWVAEQSRRRQWLKWPTIFMAISILAACLVQTRIQLECWRNTDSLCQHGVAITGENPRLEYIWGLGREQAGDWPEAIRHYRNATQFQPAVKEAFYSLARLLGQTGDWAGAEKIYNARLAVYPDDFAAHIGLITALPRLGRMADAEVHLQTALRICPDTPEALNNLAWTLSANAAANLRNGARAVALAERACVLTGYRETMMVGTLAAAYAEAGRFDEAIAMAQKACAVAATTGQASLRQINEHLLELYRQHQPCREDDLAH